MIKFTDLRVTKDGKQLIIGAKVKEDSYYDNVYIDKVVIDTEETFNPTGPSDNGIEIQVSREIDVSTLPPATYVGIYYEGEFYDEDGETGNPNLNSPVQYHEITSFNEKDVSRWYTYKDKNTNEYYIWDGSRFIKLGYFREIYLTLDKNDLVNNKGEFTTVDNHLFYVYVIAGGVPESDCPCGMDNQTTLGVTMYTGHYYDDFMNYIKELGDDCNIPQGLIDYILRYKVLVNSIDTGHYTEANKFYNKWFKEGYSIPMSKYNCGCYG